MKISVFRLGHKGCLSKKWGLSLCFLSWAIIFAATSLLAQETPAADEKTAEQADVPILDAPEELKRLDASEPIWVTKDRTRVLLNGTICLREGLLEFFACRTGSKEHESIIALDIKPYLIHAALLVIGAKKGTPAQFEPDFAPPTGEEIEVRVRWRTTNGEIREVRAQEMIREEKSGQAMKAPWVFTGGVLGKTEEGKPYYLADITGEIFGVSNFAGSILDVPFESSSSNESLFYEPFTENIPEVGTPVTLILSRAR